MPRTPSRRAAFPPLALTLATLVCAAACSTAPQRAEPPRPASPVATAAAAPATPVATPPANPATAPAPQDILATVPAISAAALEPSLATPQAPVVLDVRTPEEYAAGHLPGARLVPHDQLGARLAELAASKDQEVIVYCRSGRRAALAIDTLKRAGFSRVGHLQGDFQGWSAEGREVVAAPATPAAQ